MSLDLGYILASMIGFFVALALVIICWIVGIIIGFYAGYAAHRHYYFCLINGVKR